MGPLIVLGVLVTLVVIFFVNAIKIVPEYQRLVVFRLGRLLATKGPGLVILIPFVDRGTKVDLREFFLEIPRQDSITKDNAAIAIDFILYYKVIDPADSVVKVSNFAGAATNIAATTLRAVVGDISLDDMLARRDEINSVLRIKLDEVTERWGVKVTNVEIREIIPPPMVQEAMTRQMSAERTRRAVVTEAEGTKSAAITVSEGNKQAAILEAEGQRQSAILRAEGFAEALAKIQTVAKDVDIRTLSLQYLETLKVVGASPSTKFVLPMEVTGLLQRLASDARKAFGVEGEGLGGSS